MHITGFNNKTGDVPVINKYSDGTQISSHEHVNLHENETTTETSE